VTSGYSMKSRDMMRTCGLYSGLWDGTPMFMGRAATDHRSVTGKRVAMCLLAQPGAIADFMLSDAIRSQGLLARYLVSDPKGGEARPYVRPSKEAAEALQKFYRRVTDHLYAPLPFKPVTENVLNPRPITLSEQAFERWVAFHDEIEFERVEGGRYFPIREFACKAAEHALRIAATQALFANRDAEKNMGKTMARAIVLAKYYLEENLRLASAELDPDLILAEKTLDWINRRGFDVVTLAQLYREGPTQLRKAERARRIAAILCDHGYLAVIDGGQEIDGKLCEAFEVL